MLIELQTRLNNLVDAFNDFKKDYQDKEIRRDERKGKIINLLCDLSRENYNSNEYKIVLAEIEQEIKKL